MDELEALEAVASLSLLTDGVENGINQLSTLGVVTLSPVVTSAGLAENEVVGPEQLTEWACTDGVHGTGLEIYEDSTWDITSAGGLIVVNVDTLDLEFGISAIFTAGVNAMLVRDDFPELSTNLVAALAGLDVTDLSHLIRGKGVEILANIVLLII